MLSRHRKKNAEISKQHAIPEDEEGEEDALGQRASGATRCGVVDAERVY